MLDLKKWMKKVTDALSPSSVAATKVGNYYSQAAGIVAMKNGGCVTVKIAITASANVSSRTTIANVPAGYRPMTEVYGQINSYGTYFLVQANGNVQVESMVNGYNYYGMATYTKA